MDRLSRFGIHRIVRTGFTAAVLTAILNSSFCPLLVLGQDDAIGLRAPDGFRVSLFADDDLAHDIYCMTVDSLGRVVVSGPGYVRILLDEDGDGKAETARQFADGPKSGAQGMYFLGRDLLCIGDEGLLRYRDRDGDDRADGPPDVFLKMKTGSEHHVHSIQKGPDGWWYIIAGNFADITSAYVTLPTSPIRKPENGVVMRLKPDLSGGEIVFDGIRNAYDFAFNRQGDLFLYDSDDERDVSLPSYRPTRIFHAVPAAHAGWVSRSWRRPDYYPDMPPVLGETGRGSPTGVVCYQHDQFPAPYREALFVLDWTFGRVTALPLKRAGDGWTSEPIEFLKGVGQFGFAPTDVEVGPDGSLYVCVGGRGTRGSVFRVTWDGDAATLDATEAAKNTDDSDGPILPVLAEADSSDPLSECLDAPQPLSSWARARWEPLARELGKPALVAAALDEQRSTAARCRAVEIVTELFDGFEAGDYAQLAEAKPAEVRARAVWSLGRMHSASPPAVLNAYLADDDPLVVRFALESLLGLDSASGLANSRSLLVKCLSSSSPLLRQTAARVVARLSLSEQNAVAVALRGGSTPAILAYALGTVTRSDSFNAGALELGIQGAETDAAQPLKLDALRLVQLALGGAGPGAKRDPIFEGYASRLDLTPHERLLDPARIRLVKLFPTGDARLDHELSRTLAMLTPFNAQLLDRVTEQLTAESDPVDDLHYLIVAARIPVDRNGAQRQAIASALIALDAKLAAHEKKQDTNWEPRVAEIYKRLVELDPGLPSAIVRHEDFGRSGHVMFLRSLPPGNLQGVIDAFVRAIEDDPNYVWTNDVVFVVGDSNVPAHRELVRKRFEDFALRGAVLMSLSEQPEAGDRPKFLAGLESSQVEVLDACVTALSALPADPAAAEQFTLLRAARRLGRDKREFPIREQLVRLLRRNTQQNFGFIFGEAGYAPQAEVWGKWQAWLEERFPDEAARQAGSLGNDLEQLEPLLAAADWSAGDATRGRDVFAKRSCVQCHGGRQALGPDLAGVARRFSRNDLFTAIAVPDRDVSPRYQTTLIETVQGKIYTGLVIYESVEGLLLRDAQNQTFRIETADIENRRTLPSSLMPGGLLKDLTAADLADLYAYLASLGED